MDGIFHTLELITAVEMLCAPCFRPPSECISFFTGGILNYFPAICLKVGEIGVMELIPVTQCRSNARQTSSNNLTA